MLQLYKGSVAYIVAERALLGDDAAQLEAIMCRSDMCFVYMIVNYEHKAIKEHIVSRIRTD
jgi:hypothetical protein